MKRSAIRYISVLFVLMLSGFFLSGCGGGGDDSTGHWNEGDGTSDTTAPTVTRNSPLNEAGAVPIGLSLTATFDEEMDSATIDTTSFTLQKSGLPLGPELPGQVTYTGLIATFNPDSELDADTEYTATITTGVSDLAGNPLASNHVWTFTTAAAAVDGSPTVILTTPYNLEQNVALNSSVRATFSETMNAATINALTFALYNASSLAVMGTVDYVNQVAIFIPDLALDTNAAYTAVITSDATDLAGNFLVNDQVPPVVSNYEWTFTTGVTNDSTAPTVISTIPVDLAVDVALNKNVSATFSESMDPTTIDDITFTLYNGASLVSGKVTNIGLTATFDPDSDLDPGTEYTATITTDATDLAGNPLAADKVWTFTTFAGLAQGPLPVDLGTAEDFAILSKSGISTTGTTFITGDIGVSPATSTAITGFGLIFTPADAFATSTLVSGKVYAPNFATPTPAKMTAAISDLRLAIIDAAGRSLPDGTELYSGNLSGRTFAPGLYKWSTDVLVDASTAVTLSGGANDVWIFQIAGDLTLASGASVTLGGSAQAKNVFWQVGGGSGVTLEAGSQFKGIAMADTKIVLKAGATVDGRLLAETGITLISNTITQP